MRPEAGGPLSGRVALITGAGGGVGRGLARAFAAAGAAVYATGRRLETVQETARGHAAVRALACDVTDRGAIARAVGVAVAEQERLDVVVHNAVHGSSDVAMRVEDVTDEQWQAQWGVAATASFDCAQLAYPHLRATGGSLLLLSSMNAAVGSATLPVYGATKAMQRGLAKSLAREWGPSGVRVNCLMPLARTPALDAFFAADPGNEPRLAARTPLGRIGDPEHDIGPAAVFLASDGARYVTGQTLVVDGGTFTGF